MINVILVLLIAFVFISVCILVQKVTEALLSKYIEKGGLYPLIPIVWIALVMLSLITIASLI